MKQAALDLKLSVKKTRKREFLAQMECVVPWAALVALIAPHYPEGRTGRPPFALETMLRVHFLQQWFIACRTRRWKKPSLTPRYTASLPGSTSFPVCLTRAPSCGFATGWKSTSGPMPSWRVSMSWLSSQGLLISGTSG